MRILNDFKSNDLVSAYSKGVTAAFCVSAYSKGFSSFGSPALDLRSSAGFPSAAPPAQIPSEKSEEVYHKGKRNSSELITCW